MLWDKGGCALTEPILHGSALAFLTLGTLFNKNANLNQTDGDVGWHEWSLGEDVPKARRECRVLFYNCRVPQAVQADGTHPFTGKVALLRHRGRNLPGDPISQTPIPRWDVARCC